MCEGRNLFASHSLQRKTLFKRSVYLDNDDEKDNDDNDEYDDKENDDKDNDDNALMRRLSNAKPGGRSLSEGSGQ